MTATARDWRAQHLDEGEIREVPADAAGEFKRIVPSPLDTYASRNQITPEQRAAGRLLHDDYAVGVWGVRDCDDVDPSLRIPQSQSPGMPPTQVLAGLRYMDAMAAVTDGSQLVTRAVCCNELTITAIVGRSARKRQRAMTVLLVGLQDLVAYYAGEGRL